MTPTYPVVVSQGVVQQEGGRAFCLYVVLGSHARRADLVRRLREVLQTLDLEPGTAP